MMLSLDGKITSGDGTDIFDDYFDLYTQTEDSYHTRAWLCGRVTMELFASDKQENLSEYKGDSETDDFLPNINSEYYFFGVDTKGVLRWDQNTIKLGNVDKPLNLVIIVTKTTPISYLAYLRKKEISYIFAGDDQIDFTILFSKIREKFNIKTLILEGGAILNGNVIESGFVDELSLILIPMVVNDSKAPSLFENTNDSDKRLHNFKLVGIEKLENSCLWLKYIKE